MIIPNIWKTKKENKPPTSFGLFGHVRWSNPRHADAAQAGNVTGNQLATTTLVLSRCVPTLVVQHHCKNTAAPSGKLSHKYEKASIFEGNSLFRLGHVQVRKLWTSQHPRHPDRGSEHPRLGDARTIHEPPGMTWLIHPAKHVGNAWNNLPTWMVKRIKEVVIK